MECEIYYENNKNGMERLINDTTKGLIITPSVSKEYTLWHGF